MPWVIIAEWKINRKSQEISLRFFTHWVESCNVVIKQANPVVC